ncbi:MAG: hypothetical protein R8N23_00590 [Reichenbachiella sp.]|uniref:hypothetical protein n=1 Tax=Reichenbachiella sp. TaxID=2184521 RepID=UPI0029674072|nr:hypothetical protein [Reichenbachiella sp.]MDW3208331.1 hypothetical protein [Reichenbachiella sp.]
MRNIILPKQFSIFSLILFISTTTLAQDAHYWTEQYGNKSTLMSGSVVGSVDDLGAMYYNPARLALQEDPTFLISAKAYQNVSLKVKDGVGEADLGTSVFGSAPTLAAGSFNLDSVKFLKFFHGHKFAYGFLSRTNMDYTLSLSQVETLDFNDAWAGEEAYLSDLNWNKSIKEEWMGLTWAIPLDDKKKWSVGLSQFLAVHNMSSSYSQNIVAKEDGSGCVECEVATYELTRNRSTTSLGYVAKIGLNYSSKFIEVGLTYTTPKAGLRGSGDTYYRQILTDYHNSASQFSNLAEIGWGDAQSATHKAPMSAALGVGINLGKNIISISGEWFDKVDAHYAMVPTPFERQAPEDGTMILNRYVDKRKSVINYGIGMEWYLSKKVNAYTSFSTDYSSLVKTFEGDSFEETDGFDSNLFSADIYHYGGGFSLDLKKIDLTIGTVYSRGIQKVGRIARIPGENNSDSGVDLESTTDMVWERWKILIGFSLPFYSFGS